MAETKIERSFTATLTLTEAEGRGLYTLLNWGVDYKVLEQLDVLDVLSSLNTTELRQNTRNPGFIAKTSFTA